MNENKTHSSTLKMTELAILTAIIVVLQLSGTAIKIPGGTSISLVLLPIVVGAILLGPLCGAFLGFVFGLITFLMGAFGVDYFTFVLFTDHPVWTAVVCLGKAICAGLAAGLLYKALAAKAPKAATFVAAAAAPIVNTGLFILGALLMSDTLSANFVADGTTVLYFLIIGCAGVNFLFEFALNLIVAPAIARIVAVLQKRLER